MQSLSARLKFFLVASGVFLTLYACRHSMIAAVFEHRVSKALAEKFEYQNKTWEKGTLIYQGVTLGQDVSAAQLQLTPELTLFPLHLSLEVYFVEPQFQLSSSASSSFNRAMLVPHRWMCLKLDIERGSLVLEGEPLGSIEFVSGEDPSQLGTLTLSEEGRPYCTAAFRWQQENVCYDLQLESAPAFYLHPLMKFLYGALAFELQGGVIDAHLKGAGLALEGALTASDVELTTPYGELDFHKLFLKGSYGQSFSGEAAVEGGRFTHGALSLDKTHVHFSLQPDHPPCLFMEGKASLGTLEGPFTCQAQATGGVKGKIHWGTAEIPFEILQEGALTTVKSHFKEVPLCCMSSLIPFEQGKAQAHATAYFENYQFKLLELQELHLVDVKVEQFACSSIQGQAAITEMKCIESASLNIDNFSWTVGFLSCEKATAAVAIANNQFLKSEMQGRVNHIPATIIWRGAWDKIEGEISASSLVSHWIPEEAGEIRNALNPEVVGSLTASFTLQNSLFKWEGSWRVFSDEARVFGCIDIQTKAWQAAVEAPSLALAHYTPFVTQGVLQLQVQINPQRLRLTCRTTDLALQIGKQLLQIPRQSTPLDLTYLFENKKLFAQMRIPPSTLYLPSVAAPMHMEAGVLTYKEGKVEIKDLFASLEETTFKGNLVYWHTPRPHIQIVANSLEGPVENLAIFDKRLTGWSGRFKSGQEEFLLDGDLERASFHLHLTTWIEGLSYRFTPAMTLREGALQLNYNSMQKEISVLGMTGLLSTAEKTLAFKIPSLTLQEDRYHCSLEVPEMGAVNVRGSLHPESISLELSSAGVKVAGVSIAPFEGHMTYRNNHITIENLVVGQTRLTGHGFCENRIWFFPNWTAEYKEMKLRGSGCFEQGVCQLKAEGSWNTAAFEASLDWDFNLQQGKNGRVALEHAGCKALVTINGLKYRGAKLESAETQAVITHPQLKEPLRVPLTLSWTPQRWMFQGPISQGMYENDLLVVRARDIHALYEKGILHFQSKLQINESTVKAKGHLTQEGGGVIKFQEADHTLEVAFAAFAEITHIQGKLFGIDAVCHKKGTLFEGRLKIETSDPLAQLLNKPEWKQIENLEFVGLLSSQSLKGKIFGTDVRWKGYCLGQLQLFVDYGPTYFEIKQLKIADPAGRLTLKECQGHRSHPLKAWEITIPHLRGEQIQPSLVRTSEGPPSKPKPFQIRQLTCTDITGILGRPLTFKGQASFYFIQKEKRDPSLFDIPRAFLKEWGLDWALFSPVRGEATVELAHGKMVFKSLSEAFSDGNHSEFYLAPQEPSYIDLNGSLFLNLRMKQDVALKLVEPFTILVRGTWEKPLYTLSTK